MIKKVILNLILLLILLFFILFISLSTIGIETNKFNDLVSEKISKAKNIDVGLKKIKFKLDPKELSLFLETSRPSLSYKNSKIPIKHVKVYVDFLSLLKTNLKIKKISLDSDELNINQINQLSKIIKPSNFKSFLNNKVSEVKLVSKLEIFLNANGDFENYIARGKIKDLQAVVLNNINLSKTNLDFFADKDDILLKNISANVEGISISKGDATLNLEDGIKLDGNFNSNINLKENNLNKFFKIFENYNFYENIKLFNGDFRNNISINLDKTYKVVNYNFKILGKVNKGIFDLSKSFKNEIFTDEINKIYFSDFDIDINFSPKKYVLAIKGNYSFNDLDFLKFNLKNNFSNSISNYVIDFDFKNNINLDIINFKKSKSSNANFFIDLEKKDSKIFIKKLNFSEEKNFIKISGLELKDNEIFSFNNIEVSTSKNNFKVKNNKKLIVKGNKLDATNLNKFLDNDKGNGGFKNFSKEIEVDLKNIRVPMSEKLENFRLIGEINKGKFVKISSKGDFGGGNYLDISMTHDKDNNKKYLEIYSDLTRPLLSNYSFFKGLSGGKLLFTSLIGEKTNSKLKIENFKVIDAPGMIKLLSIADLSGLEDLAKGEGLSFDLLEINLEKSNNFLKINEILALGPSISVLMEGYQDAKGITSLRGTLVPAKTLNTLLSKIPVIGNIVVPKEAGEGLFGISFKMKGPKGNIKTTINPIRTLTPRFIQKIVDKNKVSK